MRRAIERAAMGQPLLEEEARRIALAGDSLADAVFEAAQAVRDRAFGRVVTYSPKVFFRSPIFAETAATIVRFAVRPATRASGR